MSLLLERRGLLKPTGAIAPFVNDTFTGADGTDLTAHTGETGATWVQHPANTSVLVIKNNRVRGLASNSFYVASGVPPSASYDVTGVFVLVTDNNSSTIGIAGRFDPVANTKYWIRYTSSNDTWDLQRTLAGSGASLGTSVSSPIVTTRTVILRMVGNQISVLVDGVVLIGPITDNNISAAGRVGAYAAGTSGDAVGFHLDSIQAA